MAAVAGLSFPTVAATPATERGAPIESLNSTNRQSFIVRGVLKEIKTEGSTVVIQHEEIPGYMKAMTMPFRVRKPDETLGLKVGEPVSFRLVVTPDESWIEQLVSAPSQKGGSNEPPSAVTAGDAPQRAPPTEFIFTNELGGRVDLRQLQGQALAITFFFTRCPIPEYCPRLSKNFAEASQLLKQTPGAPTNWQFLSVTFDPAYDTPAVLKNYGQRYNYDSEHWHFLTGSREQIENLGGMFGLHFQADGAFFNHDFRTVIINATGRVDMIYPVGGNLSSNIVADILKAASVGGKP